MKHSQKQHQTSKQNNMAFYSSLFLCLFALLLLLRSSKVTCEEAVSVSPTIDISLNRNSFPEGFIFGAGSSSYQVYITSYKQTHKENAQYISTNSITFFHDFDFFYVSHIVRRCCNGRW